MKALKILAALMAVLCVSLSLAACTGNTAGGTGTTVAETPAATPEVTNPVTNPVTDPEPTTVTYTVTVKDANGEGIHNVLIQMCDTAGCRLPTPTNTEGTVVFTYNAASDYRVKVVSAPEKYAVDTEAYFDFDSNNVCNIVLQERAS